ncbi:hypothetical protein J3E69DRAFT_338221 [Trichoderma sp. SZMC 28015]
MSVRRMVFAVALAGLAMAKPIKIKPTPTFCPIICIDAISDCGIPYGGCYDPCVDPAPTPLPCDVVNSTSQTPVVVSPVPATTTGENPILITPAVDNSTSVTPVVVSPVPATPTSENPFAVTPGSENSTSVTPASSGTPTSPTPVIVVSPVPATTTGESPSSVTPASQTPASETPEDSENPEDSEDPDSESPIAEDPIPAAEGAESTDLADVSMEIGSSPENPLPWIPDENEDSWWWD